MNIVVLGAGISGHTAAAFLKKKLGKKHTVTVISPSQYYQWIPSNIWVGVGRMKPDQVRFKLEKVYNRWGIIFKQAKAMEIHPEGDLSPLPGSPDAGTPDASNPAGAMNTPYVVIGYTDPDKKGQTEKVPYDYLINATGPNLNFAATEGLGPGQHTFSVCSTDHALEAWKGLEKAMEAMKQGKKQKLLIGTGHPGATCQGAAFEYALNIAFELRQRKLLSMAEITWITNEYEAGDFGMGGAFIKRGGYITSTRIFAESVLAENNIKWIKQAGVTRVEPGVVHYETLDGTYHTEPFDFAMLIPAFSGHDIRAINKQGEDITATLFAPNKFMKVDADYAPKPFEEWRVTDWPQTYQNPVYSNIYAAGIAFAPPHPISKPMKSSNGTVISPAPPRTGMPSGVIGKIIAQNIAYQIKTGKQDHPHTASMGRMGAACIVSAGYSMTRGLGATMTVSPVVPDWERYPEWGRNIDTTVGEIGLAGHWIKLFLHYMFLHKAKGYPFWWLLPE